MCKLSFLKWKHWPQRRVARMGHDHKIDATCFFDLFYEVFPKQSGSIFETKLNFFEIDNVFI